MHSNCVGRRGALAEPPLPPALSSATLLPVPWPGCMGEGILPAVRPSLPVAQFFSLLLLQKDLLGIQSLLNSSETSLHQLTAMLDCRGLHKVTDCGGCGRHQQDTFS